MFENVNQTPIVGQDAGACEVRVNPETMNVTLTIRGPLQVTPQTVILNGYQFVAVFGQAMGTLGVEMLKANERLSRQPALRAQ